MDKQWLVVLSIMWLLFLAMYYLFYSIMFQWVPHRPTTELSSLSKVTLRVSKIFWNARVTFSSQIARSMFNSTACHVNGNILFFWQSSNLVFSVLLIIYYVIVVTVSRRLLTVRAYVRRKVVRLADLWLVPLNSPAVLRSYLCLLTPPMIDMIGDWLIFYSFPKQQIPDHEY